MDNEIILSSVPLPEDENSIMLNIVSYESQLRQGLPQKQLLEGKITLNTARCLVYSLPPVENASGENALTVDRTLYDLYLVIIPFTLHQAPGGKYYTEMTLWIELADSQNTAFDLCPKNILTKGEVTKTYILSPHIKFQEIELNLGQSGKQLRFEVLHPIITASGEGQHIFYWTYRSVEDQIDIIPETKHALFIAQVPQGTRTLQGQISYEIVIAKKFLREWIFKDCSVAPYSFAWDLTQTQPFYGARAIDQAHDGSSWQDDMDVCIFCALAEEAEAFIKAVQDTCGVHFTKCFDREKREYRSTQIRNNVGEVLKLHVSWLASYGLVETSLYLPSVLREFCPRMAIMTGICAGDKRKLRLGDIVVADRAFVYGEGKVKLDQNDRPVIQPDLTTHSIHPEVLRSVGMFDAWKPLVALLAHPLPDCHIGAMASGNAVRSDNPFEQVQRVVRNAIAFDMEGAAFYRGVKDFPGVRTLLVKGVCDYGDGQKDDTFHPYAASVSALYALSFIREYVNSSLMPRLIES